MLKRSKVPAKNIEMIEDFSEEMNNVVSGKIAFFRSTFIPYTKHVNFHSRCDYLQKLGALNRGKPQMGLRVLAPSGSGKSTAGLEYKALVDRRRGDSANTSSVLFLPLKAATTSKRLMVQILRKLGDPYPDRGTEETLTYRVMQYLERRGIELLIIDEVQHLNARSSANSDVTDTLKSFLDAGVVPIVFLGTDEGKDLFERNLQLNGRLLAPFDMPALDASKGEERDLFATFVHDLCAEMHNRQVFTQSNDLLTEDVLACLLEVSAGVIGRVSRLFEAATEIALRRSAQSLEVQDLLVAVDRWALQQNFAQRNPFRLLGAA
ncbi:TniB protein [Caulobacter sp. AP07]|uniref:ATP-binding protein n=1 Tax=Caulobacter sp. AP07 TaxID=1144304 RepID=UPI000271FC01|nr:ATP-binding protein [Caulobacter sp. AP07]EJL37359.1 TniB protein [Caulobacter sp. AP07]